MKGFQQTYLCLSAQTYSIKDETTGQVNEGVSIQYVPDDTLDPETDELAASRGQISLGKKVAKMSLPVKVTEKLREFPGLYNVTLEMAIVAQKQQIRAKDIDFVSTVKLVPDKQAKQS